MKKIIYDSNEEDIHKLLKTLIHPQHINFVSVIKSEWRFGGVDFLFINSQSLKTLCVETKHWITNKHNLISVSKVRHIKRDYNNDCILLFNHKNDYYWLYTKTFDFDELKIKIINDDACYIFEDKHLNDSVEELKTFIHLKMNNK